MKALIPVVVLLLAGVSHADLSILEKQDQQRLENRVSDLEDKRDAANDAATMRAIAEARESREARAQATLERRYVGRPIGDAIALNSAPVNVQHLPSGAQIAEWERERRFMGFLWPLSPARLTLWTDEKGVVT